MSLAPGTRLGPFEVRGPLGAGGMGQVYRARDTRLDRDIALKVLPPEVARDPTRLERFAREARAIAALNHPHIVTIYSTEEAEGIRFMTMELVEGQTLDALLAEGGLTVSRFLELALPLADALTAAHQKQITHRDLKPGNVMVSADGRLKVLDFGLARVEETGHDQTVDATRAVLTGEGTIVGTMPYMSPEQVEGRALDARTDLFSLGVMFFEMLTGARPFQGPSSPALMSAILRDTPPLASADRADVPEALARLVARCLEKRPDDRVQTARDVYNELRHLQKQIESGSGRRSESGAAAAAGPEASLWIAVLPFGARSSDADTASLAAGLTEDITSGLSRFPALSVIAPQSAAAFGNSPLDVRQIAERLGARYVLGGTVRTSASAVRIAAHFVDARSGAHLWAETYDQPLAGADVFSIQDDITDRIVATVADKAGVLARSMAQAIRQLPLDELSARELILRCWMFQWQPMPGVHAEVRRALEHQLEAHPDNPHLWAELANMQICEHSLFLNPLPDPLGRAMRAARRATELDPGNQEGWEMVALASFYLKDEPAMLEASDRAIRLNPRNSNALAWMGNIRTHAGDYDRGCELTGRAMTLNPAHPGWYHFAPFNRHFARGEYAEALKAARRVNLPEFMWMQFAVASACGQIGLADEGRSAAEAMLRLAPPFADEANLREFVTRWYWPPDLIEDLLEGVARARGATATGPGPAARRSSAESGGGTTRPRSGPGSPAVRDRSIAVVPFAAAGSDSDTQALADGLTEDVTAGLSRFPYLSVVAAHSARQHRASTADARQLGKALGARYLLDGVMRRGGVALRLTVRLVDTTSGAQLWSETYNRNVTDADQLALQDDLTDRIVATVADAHGVLLRVMSQGIDALTANELDADTLALRYWAYQRQHSPAEHGLLRDAFERLVEERPAYAFAWSALAELYCHEHGFWFNARPDPLGRARKALGRALELDAVDQHGWEALALTCFFERDADGFAHASERALALNPRNANTLAWMGALTVHAGELDRGCALVERAMALNPDHPGWYHFAACNRHLVRGEHAEALRAGKRINMPQHLWAHVVVATAAGELGRAAEAASAVDAVVALAPAMADPAVVGEAARNWKWDEAVVERIMIGYRKAVALWQGSHGRSRPPSSSALPSRPPSSGTGTAADPRGSDVRPVSTISTELRIAVLPFTARGGDDAAALAEGITDEITTALARFPYLEVVSRAAVTALEGHVRDAHAASDRLRARFLLEGSIRQAASVIRVSARLADVESGAHLWAETFEREMVSGVFAVQDDLAGCITSQVADPSGALVRSMAAASGHVPLDRMTTGQLTLQFFAHLERFEPAQHAALRDAFERALEREPNDATAWGCLSDLYMQEIAPGFNPQPDPLGRQRAAAGRAINVDGTCQYGWLGLAMHRFYSGDQTGAAQACERAIALNPLNTHVVGLVGTALALTGDWDRGLSLVRRALALNPHIAGHVHLAPFLDSYRRGDDEAALASAKRFDIPTLSVGHLAQAAAAGQLGRADDARTALEALRRIDPALCTGRAAHEAFTRILRDATLVQRLTEGFEKALALGAAPRPDSGAAAAPRSQSGPAPAQASPFSAPAADPGTRVAVLPFTARGGDDAKALAEGLTDEITTALARFPYLKVVARAAVHGLTGRSHDTPGAGAELGARFLLEGSLHQVGTSMRVSVRLADRETGAHLWADTLDRDLSAGLFAVQDDIVSHLAATVADAGGVLVRSMGAAIRDLPLEGLGLDDLVLRYQLYTDQFTAADHASLSGAFEAMVARQAGAAQAWACLGMLVAAEMFFGLNPRPRPLERLRDYAERATMLDSSIQLGWTATAVLAMFDRDRAALEAAAERAIALNPLHTRTLAVVGVQLAFSGETERGAALLERAMALNPRYPGWYLIGPFLHAYGRGEYEAANRHARRIGMPKFVPGLSAAASAAGQTGSVVDARAALEALARVNPALLEPAEARRHWGTLVWDTAAVERLVDGFARALSLAAPAKPPASSAGQRARPAAGETPAASIAVLPFADLSPDKDQEWFCDGVAEEILNALTQLPGLRVAARTSAFTFRAREADLDAIAGALHVATVLQGSVRRAGDRVRITVQLVDAANGYQLWSERYDREIADIFDVQDEIARGVAERLKVTLSSATDRIVEQRTASIAAYDLYLKGRALLYQRGASIMPALEQFRKAVEIDPDFALAWAGVADAYVVMAYFGLARGQEARQEGLTAARRALALSPGLPEALTAVAGLELICENDATAAERHFAQALARNSSYIQARCWYALFFLQLTKGRFDEGVEEMRRTQALDPLSAYVATVFAVTLWQAGTATEAVEAAKRAVHLDPHSFIAHWALGNGLRDAGHLAEAEAEMTRAAEMSRRHPFSVFAQAAIHERRGRPDLASECHEELLGRAGATYVPLTMLALTADRAGRRDEAIDLARRALADREPPFLLFARHFSDFAPIRRDPQFVSLVRELDALPPLQNTDEASG
jgi:TolB-like protein/Tfp pilus assembly protein PilF